MNKQRLHSIINNPESVKLSDAKELTDLARSHPYSQILYSLLAKSYAGRDVDRYKKVVGLAAMYATDRHVLKELVTPKATQAKIKEQVKTTISTKSNPLESKQIDPDLSSFNNDSELLRNTLWSDLEQLKLNKAHYLEHLEAFELEESKPNKKKTSVKSSSTKKTSSSSNSLKKSKAKSTSPAAKKPVTAKKIAAKKPTSKPTTKKAVVEKKELAKKKTASKSKEKPKAKTVTKLTVKRADSTSKKTVGASTKKKSSAVKKKAEVKLEPKASIKEQIKIIDSFIDKEPSISSKRVTSVSGDQQDLSVQSTSFGDDLISENLAQILVEQGKQQKAIDMYKKLIWKFPQKKTYFAARIEELTK